MPTIDARARDVLLLAAERIHHRSLRGTVEGALEGAYDSSLGNRFCCTAIEDAIYQLACDEDAEELKKRLFLTFKPEGGSYIWSPNALDSEARILGLLLLREMSTPARRPRKAKRKRALA